MIPFFSEMINARSLSALAVQYTMSLTGVDAERLFRHADEIYNDCFKVDSVYTWRRQKDVNYLAQTRRCTSLFIKADEISYHVCQFHLPFFREHDNSHARISLYLSARRRDEYGQYLHGDIQEVNCPRYAILRQEKCFESKIYELKLTLF